MGKIDVRAYCRQDGTLVRQHQRKGFWGRLRNSQPPPTQNLHSLAVQDVPKKTLPTPDIKALRKSVWSVSEKGIFGRLSNYRRNNNRSLSRDVFVGASVPTAIIGGGAAFLAAPVVVSVAGAAYLAAVAGSLIFEYVIFPMTIKRKMKKSVALDSDKIKTPTEKDLDALCSHYDWSAENKNSVKGSSRSKVSSKGWGKVTWEEKRNLFRKDIFKFKMSSYFFPGANHSKTYFDFPVSLPKVNLEDAKLDNTLFEICNFDGANFKNADLQTASMKGTAKNANFEGANLTNAYFGKLDVSGANFKNANLRNAWLSPNLCGAVLSRSQAEDLLTSRKGYYTYTQHSFDESIKSLGVSETQFEFLVLSGSIRVRDNITKEVVAQNFDPEKHHIPSWEILEFKLLLEANKLNSTK